MELWDVYDINGNKTGKTVERGELNGTVNLGEDEYHLIVHVWTVNSKGEFLISKRTPNKRFPNMWESTGGSALIGESSFDASIREAKEELGVNLKAENAKFFKRYTERKVIIDVWTFRQDVNIDDVVFQEGETNDAKLADKEEILEMIKEGKFFNNVYVNELFEFLNV